MATSTSAVAGGPNSSVTAITAGIVTTVGQAEAGDTNREVAAGPATVGTADVTIITVDITDTVEAGASRDTRCAVTRNSVITVLGVTNPGTVDLPVTVSAGRDGADMG